MKLATKGDTVTVHYTGKLEDGTVFDSSRNRSPLKINLGKQELIPGFEHALYGMHEGQVKNVKIPPEEAYGDYVAELVKEIDRKFLPTDLHPQVGMQLQLGEGEEMTIVTITSVTDKNIILDANHPLSGKTLDFEIELVKIH